MSGYLRGQPVTQRVQYRPQCNVGIVTIKLEPLANSLEPEVGLLNSCVLRRRLGGKQIRMTYGKGGGSRTTRVRAVPSAE
jgi:hypothetical protein